MALLSRKKQIAAKVESTKGTAETLSASDVTVYAEDLTFDYSPDEVVRNPLRSTLSRLASIPGRRIATLTCRVEIKGSGTSTTATSWGTLLRGCGFSETEGASDVTYAFDSDDADTDTLTIAILNDGRQDLMYGARGTVSFEFTANQIVYATFNFTGIFSDTTDQSMYTGTFESTVPVTWKNASVTIGDLTGSTLVVSAMTLDMNNTVTIRDNANATNGLSYAVITDRDPGGTADPDKVLVATTDWIDKLHTPTLFTVETTVGSATGNTVKFSASSKAQIIARGDGDRDGVAVDNITFKLRDTSSTGDGEISIVTYKH